VTQGLHPEGVICAFIGVKGREVKQHLLMDGERLLNEAFNSALKLAYKVGS
jgi:hypothetical protein